MVNPDSASGADDIVAQFPGPVTLLPSLVKWWIVVILGVVMTSASLWVAALPFISVVRVKGGGSPYPLTAVGLFGAVFSGLGIVVAGMSLLPGRSLLLLDRNGFEYAYPLRKRKRFSWEEVSDFGTYRFKSTSVVVFKTATPRSNIWKKVNTFLTGRDDGLPDTYGFDAEDLA